MDTPFSVAWKSPANIALVKYWGKHGQQLPNNPSLSITLSGACTQTVVVFTKTSKLAEPNVSFLFHGMPQPHFELRIKKYIQLLFTEMPFLTFYKLEVRSSNNFPHSSGISSSASFMSSLALCLCSAEQNLMAIKHSDFFRRASFIARLGSGSAARSIYGGYVSWGASETLNGSANECAMPCNDNIHKVFQNFRDAILVIDPGSKALSSSNGHLLMESNPYSRVRYAEANKNFSALLKYLNNGNILGFIEIAEHEALSLHAMLLASNPWQILLKANTIAVLHLVREYRETTGIPICFTLDAGPNVHLLYPQEYIIQVHEFINSKLKALCFNSNWIDDCIGTGPELLC